MTDERFNELLDEMIGGLPVTLIVPRLALALKYLIDTATTGVGAETALEHFVKQQREE